MVTKEQRRQIVEEAKNTEITLNGYAADFSDGKDHVKVFDVQTFEEVIVSYAEFEKVILTTGDFKS